MTRPWAPALSELARGIMAEPGRIEAGGSTAEPGRLGECTAVDWDRWLSMGIRPLESVPGTMPLPEPSRVDEDGRDSLTLRGRGGAEVTRARPAGRPSVSSPAKPQRGRAVPARWAAREAEASPSEANNDDVWPSTFALARFALRSALAAALVAASTSFAASSTAASAAAHAVFAASAALMASASAARASSTADASPEAIATATLSAAAATAAVASSTSCVATTLAASACAD